MYSLQNKHLLILAHTQTCKTQDEKSGGGAGGEGECVETGVELFTRERRSLDILSVKKEAKLSASELAEVKVGNGEEYLRCSRLLTV